MNLMKSDFINYKNNFPTCFSFKRNIKVGLLGGSFNPAHDGHIHLSLIAKKKLKLNEVWWLVTPQNRLKKQIISSSFYDRLKYARTYSKNFKKIKVLDLEFNQKISSTWETLNYIKKKTRITKFYWIMGSDNLSSFQKWLRPKLIAKTFPVAVIARPGYSYNVLNSIGARVLGDVVRFKGRSTINLKDKSWVFIRDKLNYNSSTKIRNLNQKINYNE